jgi:hypothetical protein
MPTGDNLCPRPAGAAGNAVVSTPCPECERGASAHRLCRPQRLLRPPFGDSFSFSMGPDSVLRRDRERWPYFAPGGSNTDRELIVVGATKGSRPSKQKRQPIRLPFCWSGRLDSNQRLLDPQPPPEHPGHRHCDKPQPAVITNFRLTGECSSQVAGLSVIIPEVPLFAAWGGT